MLPHLPNLNTLIPHLHLPHFGFPQPSGGRFPRFG
jgi:hypothetical protein